MRADPLGMKIQPKGSFANPTHVRRAFERYVSAREYVIDCGFESEIEWQANRDFENLEESDFLREAAWVVLNTGMRESVVRAKFSAIEDAFLSFSSGHVIVENRHRCLGDALRVFNHQKKMEAIVSIAIRVTLDGFDRIKAASRSYGTEFLTSLDFVGPVTSHHLAKNLGIQDSKSDRHLQRISSVLGFPNVGSLCIALSDLSGDPVSVVDVVMWRFATLRRDYQEWFSLPSPSFVYECRN